MDRIKANTPDYSWAGFKIEFGSRYTSLIKELIELVEAKKESYSARIVFRSVKRIYTSIGTIDLYFKQLT